jgi:hypothetical protein
MKLKPMPRTRQQHPAVLTQFIPCESRLVPASFDEQLPYQPVMAV